jgi:dTDP-4-amino-4,6-dideoxygalactose transaminase
MKRRFTPMSHYNSWPLGSLPDEWQRPEPAQIKLLGYQWQDPRDIIDIFEKEIASFSGSKYAVLTDCCTNGIFLSMKYRKVAGEIVIPRNTYVSIPMQILHVGAIPVFEFEAWSGIYELGSTEIFDGAARFTENMFVGGDALQVLSFQIKKKLPIGKGGAILTDSLEAYEWLKLASYDGRNLQTPYNASNHVEQLGWHFYMTPEDAARGLILLSQLPRVNPDTMDWNHYPDLSGMPVFNNITKTGL